MIAFDTQLVVVLRNSEIKTALSQLQPYQQWLDTHLVRLTQLPQRSIVVAPLAGAMDTHLVRLAQLPQPPSSVDAAPDAGTLFRLQRLFGYTHEDVELVLRPMLAENKEPVWSMGDDTPLAALSCQSRSLSDYFHQRFAQVTNPPIDPLRERGVTSLGCYLGRRQNFLAESALHAQLLHLETP